MTDHDSSPEHLSALCKIKLTNQEKETLGHSLEKVLKYMALLDQVDIEGISPCTTILETVTNVLQDDLPSPPIDLDTFFQNVPEHVGKMVKVPPVIEFEE